MQDNQEDIYLLHNNPGGFIIKYQKIIDIIVQKKLINSGYFKISEKNDLTQTISKQLLKKIPSIKKNYNESFLLATYCSATINNLCKEIIRKLKKQPELIYDLPTEKEFFDNIIDNLIIDEAIDKFDKILKLFHKENFKLKLCLKLYCGIKISRDDFEYLESNIKINSEKLLEICNKLSENHKLTKNEIHKQLTLIFNNIESTNNTDDAIRKWIKKKNYEILVLLNGNNDNANFNEETLQILIEKYFDKKSKIAI